MSLAFLAKKSWHTTNINNQEKVWLKQQEQEQEKKKLELIKKQMKEERELEEMREASGQPRQTEKLTWMYSQPINLNTEDEYLMGKEKEPEKEDEELKKVVTNQGISQAFIEKQKDPAKAWRDDMNKIRDDPLLAIKQAEKKQREKIMDNPLKIKQFKEELEKKRLAKEEKKTMKKAAKKAKKDKKHGKGNRSASSDDEEDRRKTALDPSFIRGGLSSGRDWDQDKGREREAARERGREEDRDRDRSRDKDHDRASERDSGRDRARSRDVDRGTDHDRIRRKSRWEEKNDESREPVRERKSRWDSKEDKRDDDPSRKRARSPDGKDGGREDGKDKVEGADAKRVFTKSQAETKFGYGLWKGDNPEERTEAKKYDPMAVKVQKKEEYAFSGRKGIIDNGAEAARKHHAQSGPKMTAGEKAAALAAMMGNAAAHDSHRSERIKIAEEAIAREKALAVEEATSKDADINFQSKLNKDAFMDSSTSMAERLSQRKHYRERLEDE